MMEKTLKESIERQRDAFFAAGDVVACFREVDDALIRLGQSITRLRNERRIKDVKCQDLQEFRSQLQETRVNLMMTLNRNMQKELNEVLTEKEIK